MDPATLQAIGTIIAAVGGGAAITGIFNGLSKIASGASHRERVRNTNLEAQRVKAIEDRRIAEAERDTADDKRREAEEHVSILKRQLLEAGIKPLEREDVNK